MQILYEISEDRIILKINGSYLPHDALMLLLFFFFKIATKNAGFYPISAHLQLKIKLLA